jgi:hypothetical protein
MALRVGRGYLGNRGSAAMVAGKKIEIAHPLLVCALSNGFEISVFLERPKHWHHYDGNCNHYTDSKLG